MDMSIKYLERDIRYLCRESGDTVIYVKEMKFRSDKSMEEWENLLDDRIFSDIRQRVYYKCSICGGP